MQATTVAPEQFPFYSTRGLLGFVLSNQVVITRNQELLRMSMQDLGAQSTRIEQGLTALGAEITSEMAELKAALDAAAAAPTPEQVQAEVDRARASADRISGMVSQLQSDNPPAV